MFPSRALATEQAQFSNDAVAVRFAPGRLKPRGSQFIDLRRFLWRLKIPTEVYLPVIPRDRCLPLARLVRFADAEKSAGIGCRRAPQMRDVNARHVLQIINPKDVFLTTKLKRRKPIMGIAIGEQVAVVCCL